MLTGYVGLKSNLYVEKKNFWPWLTLLSFFMALYHCVRSAVRGMQKWVDCIVTNWLINWLELISDNFNESEIARRSILTFKMLRMDQYYSSYELFPVLNQMPLVYQNIYSTAKKCWRLTARNSRSTCEKVKITWFLSE